MTMNFAPKPRQGQFAVGINSRREIMYKSLFLSFLFVIENAQNFIYCRVECKTCFRVAPKDPHLGDPLTAWYMAVLGYRRPIIRRSVRHKHSPLHHQLRLNDNMMQHAQQKQNWNRQLYLLILNSVKTESTDVRFIKYMYIYISICIYI